MLSMNFRRGLFRLWIVASFVWLVSNGVVLQKDIRRDVATLRQPVLSVQLIPLEPPAAKGVVRKLQPDEELRAQTEMDERRARLRRLQEELRVQTETDELRARVQLAQSNLMLAASILLLPPILAFALGWAGLWIVRGFRS